MVPSVPHPIGTATFSRRKDRLSYSHEEFSIDLTQVTQTSGSNPSVRLTLPYPIHSCPDPHTSK